MTVARRHHLIVALIAALAGAGIGLEAARDGLLLAPTLGFWVGALGIVALVIVLLTAPPEAESAPLTSAETGWAEFRREMRRARRGVKALTILRIPVADPGADDATLGGRSRRSPRICAWSIAPGSTMAASTSCCPSRRAPRRMFSSRGSARSRRPSCRRTSAPRPSPMTGLTSGAIIAAVHGAALGEVPIPIRRHDGRRRRSRRRADRRRHRRRIMTRSLGRPRTPRGYAATKRLIDLGVCLIALPVLLPVGLLCALLIRLESPGPILFAQQRTGQHGVRFPMFKFRTMVQNAGGAEGVPAAPQHPPGAGLQDPERPARHEGRQVPAQDQPRRAAADPQRDPRRDVDRRAATDLVRGEHLRPVAHRAARGRARASPACGRSRAATR